MFGKLFGKKKLKEPVDISLLKTDMHSHLIPGIDDGSPNMETSLQLIREMHGLGYTKLITTPHISADIYPNTAENIQLQLQLLKNELVAHEIPVEVTAAAEYMIDDGFESLLQNKQLQTFSDKHVLIELPYFQAPPNFFELTFEMQIQGLKIILAHPERYLFWFNDLGKYEDLKNRGILFQMNMTSLSGQYSPQVQKMAEKLIDAGMIDFLGSDLHNSHYLQLLKNTLREPYLKKVMDSGKLQNHKL